MVRAAYDPFSARGYLGTTISAIALEAGVAIPTSYYTSGTKAALFDESLGAAIVGFDRWREPPSDPQIHELLPWHQWWRGFESSPTSTAAFATFFTHGVAILERVAPLVASLHGATGDPEAADVVRISEQRRVEAYRESVRVIASRPGGLRAGLTSVKATDVLVDLFSAEFTSRSGGGEDGRPDAPQHSYASCSQHNCSPTDRDRTPAPTSEAGGPKALRDWGG